MVTYDLTHVFDYQLYYEATSHHDSILYAHMLYWVGWLQARTQKPPTMLCNSPPIGHPVCVAGIVFL